MNTMKRLALAAGLLSLLSACSQSPEERQRIEEDAKRDEIIGVVSSYFDNARKIVVLQYTEGGHSDEAPDVKDAASDKIEELLKASEPFLDEGIDITSQVKARHVIEQAVRRANRDASGVAIDLGEPKIDNMRGQMPVYVNNRTCNVSLRNPGDSWKIYEVECEAAD